MLDYDYELNIWDLCLPLGKGQEAGISPVGKGQLYGTCATVETTFQHCQPFYWKWWAENRVPKHWMNS